MTDMTYDVWVDGMDNAWMGATIDIMHNVQTDSMDDAWMGAMTDVPYDVWTDGDITWISCR